MYLKKIISTSAQRMCAVVLFVVAALFFAVAAPAPAYAEEQPISVPLTYISGFSNWGPTIATGSALVWPIAFEVRISVQKLPPLTNQIYAAWFINPQTGSDMLIGRFNTASDGSAIIDESFPGHLATGYSMIMITVQPDTAAAANTAPSNIRSIAGYFQGNSSIIQQVKHLPDTGPNAQHPPFEPRSAYSSASSTPAATSSAPWRTTILEYAALAVSLAALGYLLRRSIKIIKNVRIPDRSDLR